MLHAIVACGVSVSNAAQCIGRPIGRWKPRLLCGSHPCVVATQGHPCGSHTGCPPSGIRAGLAGSLLSQGARK